MGDDVRWHPPFPLAGAKNFQAGIAECKRVLELHFAGEGKIPELNLIPDEKRGGFVAHMKDGPAIGLITARHRVTTCVNGGHKILQATVNSLGQPDADGFLPGPRIRVVTGLDLDWTPSDDSPRSYDVHLVGEQFYASAVRSCLADEPVVLWHEVANPYDKDAIAVGRLDGDIIGHLPRDSWLHRALLEEKKGCSAAVKDIFVGKRGFLEVALRVQLAGPRLEQRPYAPKGASSPPVTRLQNPASPPTTMAPLKSSPPPALQPRQGNSSMVIVMFVIWAVVMIIGVLVNMAK